MSHHGTTRRDFLRGTAGAFAAASAVPYVLSASRAGAESVNDRINVATIGVGGRGTAISRQAGRLGNMVAVCDVDTRHATRFANEFDSPPPTFVDYREVLDRDDVDAVIIGTPDHWHTKISVEAMRAGKDVYCEKPLTLCVGEGKLINCVVRETGKVFQVGTQQRTENGRVFLKAVAIARSGRLGSKLRALSSVGGAPFDGPFTPEDPPAELDWDLWQGPALWRDYTPNRVGWNFRWWLEYSGGQVTDWGVHHTDIALWALGVENTGPVEIEGDGEFPGHPETFDPADFFRGQVELPAHYNVATSFDCNLRFANGNVVNLVSRTNELIIEGEEGRRIRVNRGGLTGRPVEEIEASPADTQWLEEEVQKLYRGMRLGTHMENFFDCVKSRELPIADVFTHNRAVDACHLANIAMMLRRKLRWDPEAEVFVDDDQANALLTRPYREKYALAGLS